MVVLLSGAVVLGHYVFLFLPSVLDVDSEFFGVTFANSCLLAATILSVVEVASARILVYNLRQVVNIPQLRAPLTVEKRPPAFPTMRTGLTPR